MSDAAIRNEKEYYDIKTQLLKDFRHLQELNRETITIKMLKKAFEFDSYLFRKKREEEEKAAKEAEEEA